MRRRYGRRADAIVYMTLGLVAAGTIWSHLEMRDVGQDAPLRPADASAAPRLVVLPSEASPDLFLPTDAAVRMPALVAVLETAARDGLAVVDDLDAVRAVWAPLADTAAGAAAGGHVVVDHEGRTYSVRLID